MSLASAIHALSERRSAPRRSAEGNTPAQVLRLAALVLLVALGAGIAALPKAGHDAAPDAPAELHSAAMR